MLLYQNFLSLHFHECKRARYFKLSISSKYLPAPKATQVKVPAQGSPGFSFLTQQSGILKSAPPRQHNPRSTKIRRQFRRCFFQSFLIMSTISFIGSAKDCRTSSSDGNSLRQTGYLVPPLHFHRLLFKSGKTDPILSSLPPP